MSLFQIIFLLTDPAVAIVHGITEAGCVHYGQGQIHAGSLLHQHSMRLHLRQQELGRSWELDTSSLQGGGELDTRTRYLPEQSS